MRTWQKKFYGLAGQVATWSKDEQGVGCVIASPDKTEICLGFNGLPRNIDDTAERLTQPLKDVLMVHAERNAIINARRDLRGWRLYVTKPPCLECAKDIIQAGLDQVVCPRIDPASRWADDQLAAKRLLAEGGVSYVDIMEG